MYNSIFKNNIFKDFYTKNNLKTINKSNFFAFVYSYNHTIPCPFPTTTFLADVGVCCVFLLIFGFNALFNSSIIFGFSFPSKLFILFSSLKSSIPAFIILQLKILFNFLACSSLISNLPVVSAHFSCSSLLNNLPISSSVFLFISSLFLSILSTVGFLFPVVF